MFAEEFYLGGEWTKLWACSILGGILLHFKLSTEDPLCHGGIPMRPLRYPASGSFRVGTLEELGTRQTLLWLSLARDRCGEEGD